MDSPDDYPARTKNHRLDDEALDALRGVLDGQLWLLQDHQHRDYGVDVRLEALLGGNPTNNYVHVQVKGTDKDENVDGSVSVSPIRRTNLSYLLNQPDSLYVCFHRPSGRLLVRHVEDVRHSYSAEALSKQSTITVRFFQTLDAEFLARLNQRVLSSGRARREERRRWEVEPTKAPQLVRRGAPVHVPSDPERAREQLRSLYADGQDLAISSVFDDYAAVVTEFLGGMHIAYMAEINVGLNYGSEANPARLRIGIDLFQGALGDGRLESGTAHYTLGNAWLGLSEFERALRHFETGGYYLRDRPGILAQCHKNRGAALRGLGNLEGATDAYRQALEADPDLAEAHFALALVLRESGDLAEALHHLDQVQVLSTSGLTTHAVLGWRAELLLRTGELAHGFRELRTLVGDDNAPAWGWNWVARVVSLHGCSTLEGTEASLRFWRQYLRRFTDSLPAREEAFQCAYALKMAGRQPPIAFADFQQLAADLASATENEEAGRFWDRVGHWAQSDADWVEAECAFRLAFGHHSDFGCCLATALNFLERFEEAGPILDGFLESHPDDAVGHFQRGSAAMGIGDHGAAEQAFARAAELDPSYALAWFNRGGAIWNQRHRCLDAARVWWEAVDRFPDHELAEKLRSDLPILFGERAVVGEILAASDGHGRAQEGALR